MTPRRTLWIAAAIVLAVVLARAGVSYWLPGGEARGPDGASAVPARPPPGADDPLNPPILIRGGILNEALARPADRREDSVILGPRSTIDEWPFRRERVEGFWMQMHEVTNEEYARFDPSHAYPPGRERHPVSEVTWEEAMTYAEHLGGTLPTELQWEFAVRGPEGRLYPWGDEEPTCELATFRACGTEEAVEVMSRAAGATPEGIHDLAGNVWEWVMPIWFEPGRTPVNRASRRLRGGSYDDESFFLRATNRNNDFPAGFRMGSIGFRVIWPFDGEGD